MNFKSINNVEEQIAAGYNGYFKFTPVAVQIPNEENKLNAMAVQRVEGINPQGYVYQAKFKKEKIVLHFTAGHLRGDIMSLTGDRGHVSVPFLIARDGTIYNIHHPENQWSYHLGPDALGGNAKQSQISIGIEISNYGPLTLVGDNLETAYSRPKNQATGTEGAPDVYCSLAETEAYVALDTPYRGFKYFAAYTEAQYNSLIQLLRLLTKKYHIPAVFLQKGVRYNRTEEVIHFRGIVTHANYRNDKFDIGPAFDWDRVIAGVTQ